MKKFNVTEYLKSNKLLLAPMAGYTDIGFRHLCRSYGAGIVFTEMISCKAILHNSEKTRVLMTTEADEHPIALQLFGNDPKDFEEVLKKPFINDYDIIDINMGCPAPKIVKNGEGSALLENIPLAEKIIKSCVKNTTLPVSVKFRSGVDDNALVFEEFAKMCERAGASFITFHPRTRVQGYAGHSDWEQIKKVSQIVNIPVIASGDCLTFLDFKYLIDECGASGVMIGRGAIGRPEIFSEVANNKKLNLTLSEKIKQIQIHSDYLLKYNPLNVVSCEMKKHILAYVKNLDGSTKMRIELSRCESLSDAIKYLEEQV